MLVLTVQVQNLPVHKVKLIHMYSDSGRHRKHTCVAPAVIVQNVPFKTAMLLQHSFDC